MTTVPVHIRQSNLFGSLSDDEVKEILASCRSVTLRSGQHACRQGEVGESMFVIASGRVSINLEEPGGGLRVLNHLKPGDHFGEMSLLVGGSRSANVTAVMDTELLELTRPVFERSLARVPGFAANLCRSLGEWLRGQISGGGRHERMHVAVVRGTKQMPNIGSQMAGLVAEQGGRIAVLSDQQPMHEVTNWQTIVPGEQAEQQLLAFLSSAVTTNQRTLVDIDQSLATPRVLAQHELVLWVVDGPQSLGYLSAVLSSAPEGLAQKIQLVELVEQQEELPPALELPEQLQQPSLAGPILRVEYIQSESSRACLVPRDLSRLIRTMRGIQLGLALGGGGARGIAHIGVLEVLEREGIFFDRIAGTSAGAIVAAAYAAGIQLPKVREVFEKEMTPPRAIRWLPKAPQWYMLSVFWLGLAERKFRRYLRKYSFDQLLLPAQTVTVDLITAEHRLRESGDVVSAVLQSINHPVFGAPILCNGEALVDGGVLMNLPVTALRQKHVDFSVAVDVSKQLAHEFAGNTPETPTKKMRRPGYFSTLLRVTDVELTNLAQLHGAQCDFLLAPDTAEFPFDDFTQAAGLVEAGRQSAEAELPRLRDALNRALAWDRSDSAATYSDPPRRVA
ncbi:patatin-like phospholipase family protein [Aeoliella mucimassa]|uniref:NTE family protein RssA n=1 Tax=Aeoliella mucimassa TaxID=2527972 RepID=A0A518AJ35_9BACT|nr:patatin-like phospholipase family protein [Aeoliella mucimassa]QDU54743.1 NTE family protein RssA [Aeoliella mucimassa]